MRDFDQIVVRDEASLAWIREHVGPNAGQLGSDIVFGCDAAAPTRDPDLIGVSVHRSVQAPERNSPYADGVAALIGRLHEAAPSRRVCLFGFDAITENDGLLIAAIQDRLGHPSYVTQRGYAGDIRGFLESFGRCSHVFASRFHALVLALRWGIPFTPFDYMGKTATLLADLGYRGPILTHATLGSSLDTAVDSLLSSGDRVDPVRLAAMRARTRVNAAALDAACGGGLTASSKRMALEWLSEETASSPTVRRPIQPAPKLVGGEFGNARPLVAAFFADRDSPDYAIPLGRVCSDGRPEWVDDMLGRSTPHDEDYRVLGRLNALGGCILDIGANYGYSVASLQAVGSRLDVVSFEPFPLHEKCLARVQQHLGSRHDYRMIGLSDRNGTTEFWVPVINGTALSSLTSSLETPDVASLADNIADFSERHLPASAAYDLKFLRFRARTEALDDVWTTIPLSTTTGGIAALKIDTCGGELAVVRGAGGLIRRHHPLLIIAAPGEDLMALLESWGYEAFERHGDRLSRAEEAGSGGNCILVHEAMRERYVRIAMLDPLPSRVGRLRS